MRTWTPHGLAALLLAVVVAGCAYSEVNGIGTRTADDDHPPQNDVTSFAGCEQGDLGRWLASGEVTNNSPTTATYEVTVAFYDDDTRLDERSTWIRNLRPGEVAAIDSGWWIDGGERVNRCEILTINRWS